MEENNKYRRKIRKVRGEEKMNTIVTGASGFIGSNLLKTLLEKGNRVIGIDKDINKYYLIEDLCQDKLPSFGINFIDKNFNMIYDNINNIEQYAHAFSNVEIVYHLAASADIRKSFKDPMLDLENNVIGTNSVLELLRKRDIKNLVFSSSSSIYGITKVVPTPEDVPDIRPISMYGASKLANEAFISAYCDLYGIKAWVFRFANVVGRNQHRGVIFDFVKKLNDNQFELIILGDGNQEKSFFDVEDCVSGLLDIPKKDNNKSMEIYNLGNKETMKVKDLARIVCEEIGVSPEFKYTGGDRGWEGDTPYTILSIQKALKVGWKPKYDCRESIKRTVRWLFEKG